MPTDNSGFQSHPHERYGTLRPRRHIGDADHRAAEAESRTAGDPDGGYRSRFSHDSEKSTPGYYRVRLDDYGIEAELTASQRTGVHRYRFPADADSGRIIIDLNHGYTITTARHCGRR